MPDFSYTVIDAAGRTRTGKIPADDRRSAARTLGAQGFRVLSLTAGTAGNSATTTPATAQASHGSVSDALGSATAPAALPSKLTSRRFFGAHRTGWDFIDSFHQLHSNGLPMGDAVKLLGQRVSDPALRYLCQSLWRDISEGLSLANAMGRFPAVFDSGSLHLIEAGENTGNLSPVLKKVLDSYELQENLRTKILSSITYPATVCGLAVGVLALFVFFLIPRLRQIMGSLGTEFPLPVKILIGFSDFLVKGGPFILAALLVFILAFLRWRKNEENRIQSDRWFLSTPLAGKVILHSEIVRMTDLLATLLGSGINATDALRFSERPVGNALLRQRINHGRQMINDGAAFASAFKKHNILPINDIDILAVGENTGNLADTFSAIARRHITALDRSINNLIRVVTTAVLGSTMGLVFICVISIVLTILSVSQSISKR
jgi:type II secretory pathway component PulF